MSFVADHSTNGNPTIIGGSLKKEGFQGVVRYASAGRTDVNITKKEVEDLRANGLSIAIVCEHAATWLLEDPARVAARIQASEEIAHLAGLPLGLTYAAADFDATVWGPTAPGSQGDRNMSQIAKGLEAAAAKVGWRNLGFYGSYFAIEWLVARGLPLGAYWQTEAWSIMGFNLALHRSPHAALFQRATSRNVAGVSCDLNEVWHPNWGQRVEPHPAPATKQHMKGVATFEGAYNHDKQEVIVRGMAGNIATWGEVDEWINLQLKLKVGPHNPGEWRGKVTGVSKD